VAVALAAAVILFTVPRLQPATGTLLVIGSGRVSGSFPQTQVQLHGSAGWTALGAVSGQVPAAPAQRELLVIPVAVGVYDGIRLGDDQAVLPVIVTAGQVEPVLLGIDNGRLIYGASYAGNDQVNLGLGELSGKFVPMPAFKLQDQLGDPFDNPITAGKDLIVAAFNTSCHQTCPLYTALFFQIQKHLPPGVRLAEVTTDPSTDSSDVLANYAHSIGASWTFATGSPNALAAFWKPFGVELSSGDTHVSTLAVIDRHGYVRLVYRGVPAVGNAIPPSLVTSLDAQGLQELASRGDGWGASDVLQAVLAIGAPDQPTQGSGGPAASFDLVGTDGSRTSLAGLAGHRLVINFWASYCPPCRAEMPLLQKQVNATPGVQLVLIDEGDGSQAARDFLSAAGIHQPALLDSDLSVGHAYGVTAFPTTVFVRADGSIVGRQVGQLDERVLAAQLSNLITQ
jgi:cytochrome oxidase Cu insertion factor (SCO1/SenC/PrrC family)